MKISLTILVLLIAGSLPAAAQTVEGPGDDVVCSTYTPPKLLSASYARTQRQSLHPRSRMVALTGKPYSFRRVAQQMQILVDGTRICSVPDISMNYRDSAGRMRIESTFVLEGPDGKPAPLMVVILDPVSGIEYDLNMATQIASRFQSPKATPPPPEERAAPLPLDPFFTAKKENLGIHSFQGVNAEGTRTTTTAIPPGSNAPVTVTNEAWIWSYANAAVLNKSVTPAGRSTDVWLQISTADPDPALFRVPDGWQIVEGQTAPVTSNSSATHTAAGFRYTAMIAPSPHSDYVIHEAPYSAEQTVEWSNNLDSAATKDEPVKLYRDSSGRTRFDRPQRASYGDKESGPVFPRISNPVDDVEIILDPVNHIAHRFPLPRPDINPPSWIMPAPQSAPSNSFESKKDLGEQVMEGLRVTGTLETFRTPAGAHNNDRELIDTTESWYSPQLHVMVLGKRNAALQNSVMRLTRISTGEPDPALFQIPAGYTVVDEKAPVRVVITHPGV